MKPLSIRFRETQSSWFGKAGFIMHGCMVLVKKQNPSTQSDDLHTKFFELVSNDKTEDSFAVLTALRDVLLKVKKENP